MVIIACVNWVATARASCWFHGGSKLGQYRKACPCVDWRDYARGTWYGHEELNKVKGKVQEVKYAGGGVSMYTTELYRLGELPNISLEDTGGQENVTTCSGSLHPDWQSVEDCLPCITRWYTLENWLFPHGRAIPVTVIGMTEPGWRWVPDGV